MGLETRRWRRLAVSMVVVVWMLGCSSTPEHYTGSYGLEGADDEDSGQSVAVTEVHQEAEIFSSDGDVMTSLVVDLRFEAGDGAADRRIEGRDLRLVADVPDGSRLVADEADETRSPDQLYARRDGDWVEVDAVDIGGGEETRVRAEFDSLLPFVEPVGGDRRHYGPADLRLEVADAEGAQAELALTDTSTRRPVWTRQSSETRFFWTMTLDAVETSGEVGGGTFVGHQMRFANGLYFRGGTQMHFSGELFRLEAPLYLGTHLDFGSYDLGLGAGWSFAGTRGAGDDRALSHWAGLELALGRTTSRSYPYRSSDFLSDFSLYTRLGHRLGDFDSTGGDFPRYMFSVGVAIHPAGW